jgi:hypothetical protein
VPRTTSQTPHCCLLNVYFYIYFYKQLFIYLSSIGVPSSLTPSTSRFFLCLTDKHKYTNFSYYLNMYFFFDSFLTIFCNVSSHKKYRISITLVLKKNYSKNKNVTIYYLCIHLFLHLKLSCLYCTITHNTYAFVF